MRKIFSSFFCIGLYILGICQSNIYILIDYFRSLCQKHHVRLQPLSISLWRYESLIYVCRDIYILTVLFGHRLFIHANLLLVWLLLVDKRRGTYFDRFTWSIYQVAYLIQVSIIGILAWLYWSSYGALGFQVYFAHSQKIYTTGMHVCVY